MSKFFPIDHLRYTFNELLMTQHINMTADYTNSYKETCEQGVGILIEKELGEYVRDIVIIETRLRININLKSKISQ